ncbi:hypothetical protein [Cellulomonas aerilata]|nr:hypothetical protein [Cellulomonas aerilata]
MTMRPTPPEARLAAVAAQRALLTVAGVAGVVAALAASAPVRRPPHQRTPADDAVVDRVLRGAGSTGPGRAVWAWNPRFVAGDPGAEPLLRTFTWVAPVGGPPEPRGTVTARQGADGSGSGSVTIARTDDDAALAHALATLAPDDVLVHDDGDWLAVRGDRVRPLLAAPRTDPPAGSTVAAHRASLRDRAGRSGVRPATDGAQTDDVRADDVPTDPAPTDDPAAGR